MINMQIVKVVLKGVGKGVVKEGPRLLKQYLPGMVIGATGAVIVCGEHEKKEKGNAYKRGYEDASTIYEKKFQMQTEEFLQQKKSLEKNLNEYEMLLWEYEKEIEILEAINEKNEEVKRELLLLCYKREELLQLRKYA